MRFLAIVKYRQPFRMTPKQIFHTYADFDYQKLCQQVAVCVWNQECTGKSFVDDKIIRGIQEHLYVGLRDIIYTDFKNFSLAKNRSTS